MDINELTIGQARELSAIFGGGTSCPRSVQLFPEGERCIAVLQRGNVVTGIYSQYGEIGMLSDASVIRRWGTTKGIGELAESGPLKETTLDPCPPVRFHIREVVMMMEVNPDAWRK